MTTFEQLIRIKNPSTVVGCHVLIGLYRERLGKTVLALNKEREILADTKELLTAANASIAELKRDVDILLQGATVSSSTKTSASSSEEECSSENESVLSSRKRVRKLD